MQGIFKSSPFFIQLALLILLWGTGAMLGFLVFFLFAMLTGVSLETINSNIDAMRVMQLFASLGMFFLSAMYASRLFSENTVEYLRLRKPSIPAVVLTIIAVLVAMPFLNYIISLNEQMVLPESLKTLENYLREMEDASKILSERMLKADGIPVFLFNVLLFGVVASLGEEFFFRGAMQRIFGKIARNPHVVIWVVACIFSAFHMQFFGFLPRLLLGAFFGYLLLWTRSLWIPVIAHFVNNMISVSSYYFVTDARQLESLDTLGTKDSFWMAIVSLVLLLIVSYGIMRLGKKEQLQPGGE